MPCHSSHPTSLSRRWSTALFSGALLVTCLSSLGQQPLWAQEPPRDKPAAAAPSTRTKVIRCQDFDVTGDASASQWQQTAWNTMQPRPKSASDYPTRFKIMYSSSGIYVLFDGVDKRLTATKREDFLDLWTEDVYECFFWTDERFPVYFEYEISPLGFELPILIPNFDGQFLGWRPWMVTSARQTRKQVSVRGPAESHAAITGWTAEVFIPYELLKPLKNVPPKPGSNWRANFYRMDYDQPEPASWDWARVGASFHEYQAFGTLEFE